MANHLINLAGVPEFLADLDAGRRYWDEGDSIAHSGLAWVAGPGFAQWAAGFEFPYSSAGAFRARHLAEPIETLSQQIKKMFGRR